MTATQKPDAGPQIWIVEKGYGPHEPDTEPVFASSDGEVAQTIGRALTAQHPDAHFRAYALPLVEDLASARVERLTLRQTPAIENVVYEASEKLEVEWTFNTRFEHVEVKDLSTKKEIVVTGHDHALVRGMFAALVQDRQQKESTR